MLVFPNAKINLGLNIISKRSDGYHDLETCFYPVPWKEALEAVKSEKSTFTSSGIPIPDQGKNLIEQAYDMLAMDFELPPANVHLHKVIPIGAGLGGGSADAAFALSMFNELFKLGLDEKELTKYAVRLGADCAFFIKNRPARAQGIGDKLSEIQLDLSGKFIVLIYPNLHISTKEAYAGIVPHQPKVRIKDILENHQIEKWPELLVNDFESSIFITHPLLADIKKDLYDQGALYASMSGSGSTIYGIFDELPPFEFDSDYTVWTGIL
jgi:4-diphosphocytidyl-2-C-methyl-D-erythritol kinase